VAGASFQLGRDMNRSSSDDPYESGITFVITSCGRFDLLEICLASFLKYNTAPIAKYLLVEDSGDKRVHEVVAKFDIPMEVIANDSPLGQIAAIDRAYQTITTPYIFHCEDDWRFFRTGFIEESLPLLKQDPSMTTVLCRRPGQNPQFDAIIEGSPLHSMGRVRYKKAKLWLVPYWLGYSFNPGLRRLSDYRRLGSFSRWGDEIDASIYFKLRGMTCAVLADAACETSGVERRLPKKSVQRSLRSRWQYVHARWRHRLATLVGRMSVNRKQGRAGLPD
jgi:GT2 family glycosyltransferase